MLPNEELFLQEIAEHPHDWLPRLIFADWLEEQGDPRAELIRLSHDLTRFDCQQRELKEERLQLLREAGVKWPTPELPNSLGMKFVLIPPGEFVMGSPKAEKGRWKSMEEQQEVTIDRGFWASQCPVTKQEWEITIQTTPWKRWGAANESPRSPVVWVTWSEAVEFCEELTYREQVAGLLPGNWAYQLPGDAQWEYACRAGTSTSFYYGDDPKYKRLGEFAWFNRNERVYHAVDVGVMKPNAWDLCDMHGNVMEWCRDVVSDGNQWVRHVNKRVMRNGGWSDQGNWCRSAQKFAGNVDLPDPARSSTLGFRIVAEEVSPE